MHHLEILQRLIILSQDESLVIAKDAMLALVNLSADESGAKTLLMISESSQPENKGRDNVVQLCIRYSFFFSLKILMIFVVQRLS